MQRNTRLGGLAAITLIAAVSSATAVATAPPSSPPDGTAPATTAMEPGSTVPALSDAGVPVGTQISAEDLAALQALFDDTPFDGGQVAPRLAKWITPDTFIFVQFDGMPEEATEVRYIGVGVKGVFCSEAVPDLEGGSFTHFHRPTATDYSEGHGGEPGEQGYWMSWMSVDSFETGDGRPVEPGIDYEFSPTPAPQCGADVPTADFIAPDEQTLAPDDMLAFVESFGDEVLIGGQEPPRIAKWLNENVAMFIQLDDRDHPWRRRSATSGSTRSARSATPSSPPTSLTITATAHPNTPKAMAAHRARRPATGWRGWRHRATRRTTAGR